MTVVPKQGSRIRFITLPTASWATIGETYLVETVNPGRRGHVWLRNEAKGSGTYDPTWARVCDYYQLAAVVGG